MNVKKSNKVESKVKEAFVKVNRETGGLANTLRHMLPQFSDEWRVVARRETKSLGDFCRKEPQSGRVATYDRHPFLDTKLVLTDGCAYLREQAQCYWLFDLIAQQVPSKTDFIVKLKQQEDDSWIFSCQCFISTEIFYTQKIPYSDFPLPEITIWVENNIALLPSEH